MLFVVSRAVNGRGDIVLGLLKKRNKEDEPAETPEDQAEAPAGDDGDALSDAGRFDLLRGRLHAWWEGYDYAPPAEEPAPEPAPKAEPEPEPQTPEEWTQARREIVQKLWGEGFSTPGEAEHVKMLVKPLGLTEKQSVVDINPGLGGTSRVVAEDTGAWVTGIEADNDMATAGMELSVMAGMAKKAPIQLFEPPKIDIRERTMDAVISKEGLYVLPEKELLFEEIYKVLKPVGQVLFTDYMLPTDNHTSPALEEWIAKEHPTPVLWSVDQTVARLKDIGFEVRVSEDMTDSLQQLVLQGWKALVRDIEPGGLSRAAAGALVGEAEIWCRRLALFEANDLRCYRVHALKHESTL